ncbi:ATP adenylyltransferase-domain-containing protein [Spinellus fusiger]|nr:ATP adenylyltransferase-domain-containing protein [Spinellus fusiger]
MTELEALIQQKYTAALASKDIYFFKGETTQTTARDIKASLLGTRQSSEQVSKEKDNENPFLSPSPSLIVQERKEHRILLNKFCVVPQHILLVTKEFRRQNEPLFPGDMYEAWVAMTSASKHTPSVAFYNCGDHSGASQPHKHVQIIPLRHSGTQPPIKTAFDEIEAPKAGQLYTMNKLPYVHVILPIDCAFISSSTDPQEIEEYLGQMFFGLLDGMFQQMRHHAHTTQLSYNFIMTEEFMMLVPRSKACIGLNYRDKELVFPINALGYAGLLLCKTTEEKEALEAHPDLLEWLVEGGVPWSHEHD